MKKLSYIIAIAFLGLFMVACNGKSDAEKLTNKINKFFDAQETALDKAIETSQVEAFAETIEQKFDDFVTKIEEEFPSDENGRFQNLTEEESESASELIGERSQRIAEKLFTYALDMQKKVADTIATRLDEVSDEESK